MPRVKSNLACVAIAIALQSQSAQAQGDLLDADGIAEAIVSMTSRVWTGPRTPAPDPVPRPRRASQSIRSPYALLSVHADPGVSRQSMRRVLGALEPVRGRLDAMGWPWPIPDGDLGGGPDFDLYLSSALAADAYSDGMTVWSYFDQASTFAVLTPATPGSRLEACATAAYVDALLLSIDPAEARTWRRATATWLTWELTGQFGCEDTLSQQQAEPHRSGVAGAGASTSDSSAVMGDDGTTCTTTPSCSKIRCLFCASSRLKFRFSVTDLPENTVFAVASPKRRVKSASISTGLRPGTRRPSNTSRKVLFCGDSSITP